MDEAYLKRKFVKACEKEMPGCVVIRHEDKVTAGIPDVSVTWEGTTTWIEVKFSRPRARGKLTALQVRMLRRLSFHGSALHLLYEEELDGCRLTYIFRNNVMELCGQGFAFEDAARYVRELHLAIKEGGQCPSSSGSRS